MKVSFTWKSFWLTLCFREQGSNITQGALLFIGRAATDLLCCQGHIFTYLC